MPAAVDERQIGTNLVTGDAAAIDALLLDKGFTGRRFAAEMADGGIDVLIPPTRVQRTTMPKTLQRLIARLRNRVETSFREITDQMELARHGAHTFEGADQDRCRPPAHTPCSPNSVSDVNRHVNLHKALRIVVISGSAVDRVHGRPPDQPQNPDQPHKM